MQTEVRYEGLFNDGWMFNFGDVENGEAVGFSDNDWRSLKLPHDWGIEYPIDRDYKSSKGGGYAIGGIGWYRKHFSFEKSWENKKVFLMFDGVMCSSEVYINGTKIHEQSSGYIAFEVDLTDYLVDGDNVIAVRADNEDQPNSRWYSGRGIYRDVSLIVTDKVHVDKWGIFTATNRILPEINLSNIEIETTVANETDVNKKVVIEQFLYNADGELSGEGSGKIIAYPKGKAKNTILMQVENYKLWTVDEPYMYTLETKIIVDGEVLDDYVTRLGIRLCDFDKDKGFLLNEKPIKIKGMCLHHDCGLTGAVGHRESWIRRLKKLKEMGCNGIRCAHNPPTTEFLDLCDDMGFLVMNEAFDEWSLAKVKTLGIEYSIKETAGYNMNFSTDAGNDLVSILLRDRNHPSIILWSIGNEIIEQRLRSGYKVAKFLRDICHEYDHTRKVTAACDCIQAGPATRAFREFEDVLDVVGYNYVGRWRERAELLYEVDRNLYPNRCVIGAENPCVGGVRGDYTLNTQTTGSIRERDYTRVTVENEHLWRQVLTHDYIAGEYLWTGFSYLGEAFWPNKASSSGPMDTAGFKKDTYYYFKSIWNNSETTLHIAPHWNLDVEEGDFVPVIIYTNCVEVDLYLNGKFISRKGSVCPRIGSFFQNRDKKNYENSTSNDMHLSFDVPYIKGELKAVGYDMDGNVIATTVVKTAGKAEQIEVLADKEIVAEGEYVNLEISLLDAEGLWVPNANENVECIVHEGRFVGMDNGNNLDHSLFGNTTRDLFAGKLLAMAQASEKGIHLTLKCAEMSKEIKIKPII